jgi:hypothetical protein
MFGVLTPPQLTSADSCDALRLWRATKRNLSTRQPKSAAKRKGNSPLKKFLLGAAAALAISAPGMAAAQSGYVDLGYQSTEADIGAVESDSDGWSVGGAAAFGGNGSIGGQVDALFSSAEADGGGDVDIWNLGGHLYSRSEGGLFGGFVNFGNADVGGAGDFDFWTVGLEGQIYMSRSTFDGALSYSEADDTDASLTALDVGYTHFVTDNFSLGANLGFGQIDDGTNDADLVSYGVGAEYQFAGAPISVFGGWQHGEIDDADADADSLGIGVRYNFGSGSLLDRNRSGASLSRGGGLGRFAGLL